MDSQNKQHAILYGNQKLSLQTPGHAVSLAMKEPRLKMNVELFSSRLNSHLTHHPLDLTSPILIVTDKTRLCGYPTYLPLLIQQLEHHGLDKKNLRILIAYGTHPRQAEKESLTTYGDTFSHFDFIHHDCRDSDIFQEVGYTSSGTPIRLRKDILNASCVITMGPICHHYFAGYGGGRKLIFPGCGEKKAIYQNHGLYLDRPQNELSSTCQPGVLANNPLATDLFEIEERKSADLAIHAILDSHGTVTDFLFGNNRETYLKACRIHGKNCEINSGTFHTVIASCGGFPKDINFIQSHKAIHNAAMFVKDGGLLIMYSQCRDGIGSATFLPWFQMHSFSKAFQKLSCSYEGNGGTALAMMTKIKRITIAMVTELSTADCDLMGVQKWSHEEVQDTLNSREESVAYINNASLLVKKP